jgi:alkylation response protein AidB-like acyl-CoA dehydrogenase
MLVGSAETRGPREGGPVDLDTVGYITENFDELVPLPTEALEYRDRVRAFARASVRKVAKDVDMNDRFPAELLPEFRELGLTRVTVPKEYGGLGLQSIPALVGIEELARESVSIAIIACCESVGGLYCRFLPDCDARNRLYEVLAGGGLLAVGGTEPAAGSDAANYASHARRLDRGYVLSGEKWCISNAVVADIYLLFARTSESRKNGLSAFLVNAGTDGLVTGELEDKMGWRGMREGTVRLEELWVPESARVGDEGEGFDLLMRAFGVGRIFNSANCVGLARACIDYAFAYAHERIQFGVPISEHQAIQFRLAEMVMDYLDVRTLLYTTAARWDQAYQSMEGAGSGGAAPYADPALNVLISTLKVRAAEMAQRVASAGMDVLGGHGYVRTHPLERIYRDAKAFTYTEGTSDIQRIIIWREMARAKRDAVRTNY